MSSASRDGWMQQLISRIICTDHRIEPTWASLCHDTWLTQRPLKSCATRMLQCLRLSSYNIITFFSPLASCCVPPTPGLLIRRRPQRPCTCAWCPSIVAIPNVSTLACFVPCDPQQPARTPLFTWSQILFALTSNALRPSQLPSASLAHCLFNLSHVCCKCAGEDRGQEDGIPAVSRLADGSFSLSFRRIGIACPTSW